MRDGLPLWDSVHPQGNEFYTQDTQDTQDTQSTALPLSSMMGHKLHLKDEDSLLL